MGIKEAFLICVLALPVPSIHMDKDGHFNSQDFLKEYKWIDDLLKSMYPDSEFMIIPDRLHEQPPPGWIYVPFFWRSHWIYRREKKGERMLESALAPEGSSFHENVNALIKEYRTMMKILTTAFPDYEFIVQPKKDKSHPLHYHLMPIRWRGHRIYAREQTSS